MKNVLIAAALNGQEGFSDFAYLFNGKQYVKYDWDKDKPLPGYPRNLSLWNLPGSFSNGVDAAINGEKGFEGYGYFFKGDLYAKYDWKKDRPVAGFPKKLSIWGLPESFSSNLDAACNGKGQYAGFGYMFKGGSYVKYDWAKDRPVSGFPKPLSAWDFPSSFLSGVDAAVDGGGRFSRYTYFFKGDKYISYDWKTYRASAPKSIRALWGFKHIWKDKKPSDEVKKKALLVFIENTGQLPLPAGTPKWIEDNLEQLADTVLEGAEKAINNFEDTEGNLYDKVVLLEDQTAIFSELEKQLHDFAKKGYEIDIIVQAHGNSRGFSGYKHASISDSDILSIKTSYGKKLPIRAVYQMNCTGSGLNDEWRKIGAKVVSGADKLNYFPEPLMTLFWRKWKSGLSFEKAVKEAYSDLSDYLWIAKNIGAVNNAYKESKPVISGNGALTI